MQKLKEPSFETVNELINQFDLSQRSRFTHPYMRTRKTIFSLKYTSSSICFFAIYHRIDRMLWATSKSFVQTLNIHLSGTKLRSGFDTIPQKDAVIRYHDH